ncbi:recombinase family protein [Paenibacillus taichungensis]|nr:recombinase family protein [Paenibacillus taichungensis]MEC0195543.1 recombinase family protein [Paenibacillus taichungensis]
MNKKREGLTEILDFCPKGDTLIVWRLDRLGRNIQVLE